MRLSTYIRDTITSVMEGIQEAEEELSRSQRGQIWTGNTTTLGSDLVQLHLFKIDRGKKENGPDGKPLSDVGIIIEFEARITVEDESGTSGGSEVGGGFRIGVVDLGAKQSRRARRRHEEARTHTIKFAVPVALTRG